MTSAKKIELAELIDAVCEGRITPPDVARLEALLRSDSEAQTFYLQHVHLHSTLRWEMGSAAELTAVRRLAPRWRLRVLVWAAAAAVLFLSAGLVYFNQNGNASVATLTQSVDADWENEHLHRGSALLPGTLKLRSGLAQIAFHNGPALTLEGPAELQIARDGALLRRGQLTAHVPDDAGSFRLATRRLTIAEEQGARFGIAAQENGSTEVCVFEGNLQVANAARSSRLVDEGAAVCVASSDPAIAAIDFAPQRFQKAWSLGFGVLHTHGSITFAEPGRHRRPSHYEDDDHLVIFPEGESMLLGRDIRATAVAPARYAGPFGQDASTIPAGTRVRSYLLQFNPIGRKKAPVRRIVGSIAFAAPIVAVIATGAGLAASERIVATEPLGNRSARGLEGGDAFEISANRRTLSVDLTAAPGVDQLRVLVAR